MEVLQIEAWYWWVAAAVFIAIEVFAPGIVFLWFGIGAAAVGIVLLVVPSLGLAFQLLVFAIVSLGSLTVGRRFLFRRPTPSDNPTLNRRGEQYVGRELTLTEAIVNGRGRTRVGDGTWKVAGPDLKAGTKVRITGMDGTALKVERADEHA